jgi:hypothetical protein
MLNAICTSHASVSHDFILFFLREAYTPLFTALEDMPQSMRVKELSKIHNQLQMLSYDRAFEYLVDLYHTSLYKKVASPPDFHVSYPTEPYLMAVAMKAGFKSSYRTCRGISASTIFSNKFLFDTTIPDLSLYMEFVK